MMKMMMMKYLKNSKLILTNYLLNFINLDIDLPIILLMIISKFWILEYFHQHNQVFKQMKDFCKMTNLHFLNLEFIHQIILLFIQFYLMNIFEFFYIFIIINHNLNIFHLIIYLFNYSKSLFFNYFELFIYLAQIIIFRMLIFIYLITEFY